MVEEYDQLLQQEKLLDRYICFLLLGRNFSPGKKIIAIIKTEITVNNANTISKELLTFIHKITTRIGRN